MSANNDIGYDLNDILMQDDDDLYKELTTEVDTKPDPKLIAAVKPKPDPKLIAAVKVKPEPDLDCDEEYQRKLDEQKRLREEYLAFKAKRRRDSVPEHEVNANLALKQLQEKRRSVNDSSHPNKKKKPFGRVDTNGTFTDRFANQKNGNSKANSKNILQGLPHGRDISTNKENKSQNQNFGGSTVVITNLPPESNEYTLKSIAEKVGKIVSTCVALEGNVRKGMVRFLSPVDALLFQRNYNNFRLGSSIIHTKIIQ